MDMKVHDAGDELLANRRSSAPLVSREAFGGFNEAKQARLLQKSALWPAPQWQRLLKAGYNVQRLKMVKSVYDEIALRGALNRGSDYVELIYSFRAGCERWLEEGLSTGVNPQEIEVDRNAPDFAEWIDDFVRSLCGTWVEEQTGKLLRSLGEAATGSDDLKRLLNTMWMMDPDRRLSSMRLWSNDDELAVKEGWPQPVPLWKVRGYTVTPVSEWEIGRFARAEANDQPRSKWFVGRMGEGWAWFNFGPEKLLTYIQAFEEWKGFSGWVLAKPCNSEDAKPCMVFATEEEAVEMAKKVSRRMAPTKGPWEPDGVDARNCLRVGPEVDDPGVDSTVVKERFGLRGLNFGNWVTQAERRNHLRHMNWALFDLAEVLGFEDLRDIGGDGELGVAVGAQGRKKAAAHYVPGFFEVNLTRMNGVGSLGHEYGHHLDHMCSRLLGGASGSREYLSGRVDVQPYEYEFSTEHGSMWIDGEKVRPELAVAMADVMRALKYEKNVKEREMSMLVSRGLKYRRKVTVAIHKGAGGNRLLRTQMRQAWARLKMDDWDEYKPPETQEDERRALIGLFPKAALKAVGGLKGLEVAIASACKWMSKEREALRYGFAFYDSRRTRYLRAAEAMDAESGAENAKAYWATPHEMFARAFSDWLQLELRQNGRKNEYLTRDVAKLYEQRAKEEGEGPVPHLMSYEAEVVQPMFRNLLTLYVTAILSRKAGREEQTHAA